jgi:hypothetical protein
MTKIQKTNLKEQTIIDAAGEENDRIQSLLNDLELQNQALLRLNRYSQRQIAEIHTVRNFDYKPIKK